MSSTRVARCRRQQEEEEDDTQGGNEETMEEEQSKKRSRRSQTAGSRSSGKERRNVNVEEGGEDEDDEGEGEEDHDEDDDEDEAYRGRKTRRGSSSSGKGRASMKGRGGGGRKTKGSASQGLLYTTREEEDVGDAVFTQVAVEALPNQDEEETLRLQDEKGFAGLSEEQRNRLVSETVRYMLLKGSHKEAIQKSKLQADIFGRYGKGVGKRAVMEARKQLRSTFGYDIVQVPRTKFPQAAIHESYYLVNTLQNAAHSTQLNSYGPDVALRGLAMVVLGLIFCANNKIKEETLFEQLTLLDPSIHVESRGGGRDDEFFLQGDLLGLGSVDEAFEALKRGQYILREKADQPGQGYFYRLGPRAFVEVGRKQVVSFLAESLNQKVDQSLLREIDAEDQLLQAEA